MAKIMQSVVLLLGFLAVMLRSEYATAEAKTDISGSDTERIVKRQVKVDLTHGGDGHEIKVSANHGGAEVGGSISHSKSKGLEARAIGSVLLPRINGKSNSIRGSIGHNFKTGKIVGDVTRIGSLW